MDYIFKYGQLVTGLVATIALITLLVKFRDVFTVYARRLFRLKPKRFSDSAKRIYLSTPMSDINTNPQASLDSARALKTKFNSELEADVFSALDEFYDENAPDGYTVSNSPKMTIRILAELKKSDAYVLLYLEKLSTSSLIELGLALSQNKRCVVFYKEGVLPWLLRPEGQLNAVGYAVNLISVNNFEDVIYEINRQKYEIFD